MQKVEKRTDPQEKGKAEAQKQHKSVKDETEDMASGNKVHTPNMSGTKGWGDIVINKKLYVAKRRDVCRVID